MRTSSRSLAIFGAAIGLLVVVALVLVLVTSNQPVKLLPEDTAAGVVQRYILAIEEGDYQAAWGYLSPPDSEKPITYEDWRRSISVPRGNERPAYKATLGAVETTGNQATVEVIIDTFRRYDGLFDNPVNTTKVNFFLTRVDNAWKITDPVYVWWIY